MLKTLKDDFQELSLLWIHVCRFQIVDAEKAIIELTDIFAEEIAPCRVHDSGSTAVLIMIPPYVEARLWNRTLSGELPHKEIPKIGGRCDVTR